ncbi:MAG: hypothetical protein EBV06_03180 [Planctomycetia bacterium]|nr:hypothetical protein [Planctomycetia bacterium]
MINRLTHLLDKSSKNQPDASGFMLCPLPVIQMAGAAGVCPWEAIYREAFERAQRVVQPSRLEKLYALQLN